MFGHVLDLDLSFHLSRKTGEVTKVVDRGTAAIQNVLSTILFQIVPQVCVVGRGGGIVGGWLGLWGGGRGGVGGGGTCLEGVEVTKVMDRGTAGIQKVLSTILFQIVPRFPTRSGVCVWGGGIVGGWLVLWVCVWGGKGVERGRLS